MQTIKITINSTRDTTCTVKILVKKPEPKKKDIISKISELLKSYQCKTKATGKFREKKKEWDDGGIR